MFLLDNIFNSNMNRTERIIAILKARGFLIDFVGGHYYISDNASVEDVHYLEMAFEKYALGEIIHLEGYKKRSRRCWEEDVLFLCYTYDSIEPFTIEIVINPNASEDDVINFFHSMGRNGSEAGRMKRQWAEFVCEMFGLKPGVSYLESYVAYYVKAIFACGVFTCYSCDGNHENGGKIYVYSDYPSNIWHEYLWKYIVCRYFGNIPYIENGISFSDENEQRQVYQLVYNIADFLYVNRKMIRNIKKETLMNISKKFRHANNQEAIEAFYRQECERVLQDDINCFDK